MNRQCKNCGAELPEGASFCPHCAQSQIERKEVKPPHLWRKKLRYVLLGAAVVVAVGLAIYLPDRPQTFEGGAAVAYTDREGSYDLLVTFFPGDITNNRPIGSKTVTASPGETNMDTPMLGIYQNGKLADTEQFFAKVQNKMHYVVHGHIAAELIYERAEAEKPHIGLSTWAAAPDGKIVKSDVGVAKNYLSEKEMHSLERIVSAYLDLAEDRAERHIPMTMEDWSKRLDLFLMADDREILQDAGKITTEIAKAKAETEFEKYRVVQDRLFMSDFDKYMLELEETAKK